MAEDIKAYHFQKGRDVSLDQEFADARTYSKVRPGPRTLFWKAGLKWYQIPFSQVQQICHQQEKSFRRIACGGMDFTTDVLMVTLRDGSCLRIVIGDNIQTEGFRLFSCLKKAHPEIPFTEA